MNIQPIQTRYAGCHFRSRLEARYAVFFDALGIRWEYEPEGFKLPNGTQYLPDFWLPSMSAYIEIKAELRPIDVKWLEFHQVINGPASWQLPDFVVDHPRNEQQAPTPRPKRTFMFADLPRLTPHSGNTYEAAAGVGPGSPHSGWAFTSCHRCRHYGMGEHYDIAHVAFPTMMSCGHPFDPSDDSYHMTVELEAAYIAARSARFEHGESGPS